MITGYRQASFSGAPFFVSETSDSYGRRGAHHEFPYGNRGIWDDLGQKDPSRQIEAYVTSQSPGGWLAARDRLVKALQNGPGELVHPWLGRFKVVCTDFSVAHNVDEMGMCRISITFIEADTTAGQATPNLASGLLAGCDQALNVLTDLFASGFSVDGVMAFVTEATGGHLDGLLGYVQKGFDVYRQTVATLSPLLDAALGWWGQLRGQHFSLPVFTGDKLAGLAECGNLPPRDMAKDIIGLVRLISPTAESPEAAHRIYAGLYDLAKTTPPPKTISSGSHGNIQIANNVKALNLLFQGAAAVEAARLTPFLYFEHRGQADAVKDDLLKRFDNLAAQITDDRFYRAGQKVTSTALEIISQNAPNLALVAQKTLIASWPSLKLCYEIYGDLAREGELIRRNQIKHPGFLPAGQALEYLINGRK